MGAYKPLLDLVIALQRQFGHNSFLLLDADKLSCNVEASLREFCKFIGRPYSSSILHWKPKELPASWRDLEAFEGWLDNINESAGWFSKSCSQETPSRPESEPLHDRCIDINMPFYRRLIKFA